MTIEEPFFFEAYKRLLFTESLSCQYVYDS